jgi:hypothetical protein
LRIKAYSPAYFKLLELVPLLREPLALGNRVIVAGKTVVVEVGPEGVDALSRKDVESIEASW